MIPFAVVIIRSKPMPNQPDIRKLISGVLEEHFFVIAKCDEDADEEFDDAIETLLSLPGIAIVSVEDLQMVLRNAGFHSVAGSYSEWVEAHHRLTAAALSAAAEADHA
jgi:hypothetical protein